MSEAREIFDSISTLDDLKTVSNNEESAYIELKSVTEDVNKAKPAAIGDFKLRIAKEMCAFANTDSGVIAVGIDENNFQVLNNTKNLLEWLDNNMRHMLEPQLSSIITKTCVDKTGGEFVLIYVPKGNVMPYRVAAPSKYELKKDIAREYYQRIGTHSEKIAMPIVRSLYLSNNRVTNISASSRLIKYGANDDRHKEMLFSVVISPDNARLIVDYYLESEMVLLNKNFEPVLKEPIDIGWWHKDKPNIPPSDEPYDFNIHTITSDPEAKYLPDITGDTTSLSLAVMGRIYAAYIKTSFACDGVPKKVDNRLIILGDHTEIKENAWHETNNWIDEKCVVDRYVSFGPHDDNMTELYAMEHYIKENGLTYDGHSI